MAIVYDGDCAFCTRSLRLLQRLDRHGVMHLYDSHDSEGIAARFPMLAGADVDNAMFAVTADGHVFRGYFSFKRLLRELPAAWPLRLLCTIPGADVIGPRIYAWVARNRQRLGCGSDVCALPPAPSFSKTGKRELH
jgi:predicted DCC family thiol-disulfide oxidoreductase YuxK